MKAGADTKAADAAIERLARMQKGGLVEVAPGVYRVPEGAACPDVVLARLEAMADGHVRLVPAGEAWARLDSPTVAALGFGGEWATIQRLAEAGFVEVVRVAPHTSLLNLASWWGHLRRCAEDPWFWQSERRLEAYRAACRTVGSRSQRKLKGKKKRVLLKG